MFLDIDDGKLTIDELSDPKTRIKKGFVCLGVSMFNVQLDCNYSNVLLFDVASNTVEMFELHGADVSTSICRKIKINR